jgi:hypothetical protein
MEPTTDVTICDQTPLVIVATSVFDDDRISLEQLPGSLKAEPPLLEIASALRLVELQLHDGRLSLNTTVRPADSQPSREKGRQC